MKETKLDPIIAIDRKINAVWVIRGHFLSDGRVKLTRYSRDDREAYETVGQHHRGYVIETDNRTIIGIARYNKDRSPFDRGEPDERFGVANPGEVFTFDCHCSESEGGSFFKGTWRTKEDIQAGNW